ncbi:hypothetical protein CERSUDRAFT_65379 [Gelatoporia subvermispora B]|uniref:P-loop containing nucleoside triphosphate hydrolase protein n=1 Tax=Ceriporiopsis subvermispora (strain B) TaxID=914234 RepID=M2RG41_CERS8|nr:hypothetical protein CERSUDRAFT_65379 [Gelatoporia subvermispora B]
MKRNVIGRLNNLITVDVLVVSTAGDFLSLLLVVPLQTTLAIWLLHSILGWSAYVGLAAMIILYPVPGYITSVSAGVRREKMKKTDARVQTITETMQILRMIKLFGWESLAADNVSHKRTEELEYIKRYKFIYLISHLVNWIIPLLTMLTTFATYTVIMKQNLTGKISLDRICEFLHTLELLDRFAAHKSDSTLTACGIAPNMIGIRKAAFTWSGRDEESTSAGLGFTLYIENELVLKQGQINVILGPTASGKTSLLMALLGEMHYTALSPDSFVNLPRARGIAYAAQESWIQSTTIRENILFNSPYDESRYREVIHGCALDRDLNLFEAGDSTEVGERGITLRATQARITLARALYSSAETLLLDDVFAALDVHTARWIAEKCFSGTLVQGRTVILVTHNVALAIRMAQFVIKMGPNGRIESFGPMDEAVTEDADPSQPAQDIGHTEPHVVHCDPDEPGAEGRTSKLIVDGRLRSTVKLYLSAFGGTKPYLFWVVCFGAFFLGDLTITTQSWFLGYWARQYEERGRGEVNIPFYLGTYSALLILLVAFYGSGFLTYVYGSLRASHKIHENLISSILKTTFRWLDRTPTSRILARCTEDIDKVDGQLVFYLWYLIEETTMMSIRFGAILIFSPLFATPGAVLTWLGGWCGQLYMKAQLCVKREMSNANAPVLGHFATTISGLTSIRAYAAENAFRQELFRCIDRYVRASLSYYELARWVSVRLDALGGLFAASLAAYMVYGRQLGASNTGFSLAMAVEFSRMILWWIRIFNVFELNGHLERIQQYLTIEHEPEPSKTGNPPAYWPSSGALRVEQLSARYSSDGPLVLRDISFEVKSGEHVGIVGRTGSGKSSLVLALLRCIVTEGHVSYDGIQTDTINLDILRSKVTVIPQVPELLSGSLRRNLDPFEQYDDAVLNDALRSAGLFSLQSEPGTGSLSLDSQTSSGGSNLSVGQRQIIALARALVRESKILILDEDYETDAVIQRSLRNGLGKDVTLLTIAHRLRTVMDADKLLILDAGRIVSWFTPLRSQANYLTCSY